MNDADDWIGWIEFCACAEVRCRRFFAFVGETGHVTYIFTCGIFWSVGSFIYIYYNHAVGSR